MSRMQTILSPKQLDKLQACLVWLGRHATVRCAILVDLSGQDIVSWSDQEQLDIASIAALAAGDLLATLEIARMFGIGRTCNLIIQEHDEQTMMISRVGEGLLLLVMANRSAPLGWVRMAVKKASTTMLAIIGTASTPQPAPQPITHDFEAAFASKLEKIW